MADHAIPLFDPRLALANAGRVTGRGMVGRSYEIIANLIQRAALAR
jgi:hypothetical protein